MVYYYPFGISKSGQSSSFAVSTISASSALSATIIAFTASHALVTQSSGPAGPAGPAPSCGTGPQGPSGSIGFSGSRGPALVACPSGTKQCSNLTPPTGYILVCIQPPPGCTVENTFCPGETTTTTTAPPTTTTTTTTTTAPPSCTFQYDVTGPFVDSIAACAAMDAADFSVHQSGPTYYSEGTCTTLMGSGTPGPGIPSAGFYKRDSDEYYIEFSGGSIITGPTNCSGTTTTTTTVACSGIGASCPENDGDFSPTCCSTYCCNGVCAINPC